MEVGEAPVGDWNLWNHLGSYWAIKPRRNQILEPEVGETVKDKPEFGGWAAE